MWQLRTGCEIHDRGAVHCASCCGAIPTISEMQSWDPPWRSSFMEDAEYGRLAVIEYLGRGIGAIWRVRLRSTPRSSRWRRYIGK